MAKAKIKADARIANMAKAAVDAGMPRDQTEAFIKAGYIPLEGMLPFHSSARQADKSGGPEWIALGGKRGPGKSHTIMAQVMDDCLRTKDLKVLFLRRIQKSAKESMEDVIRKVFTYTPHSLTNNGLALDNGSRIVIGGYKEANDIDKYLGIEYDVIVIEECTQITEDKVIKLRGSLRSSKTTWRPRIYMSTNADGVGLAWFKKMFIEPFRSHSEAVTRFFDVTNIYNPFINAEYEAFLDSLTGSLRKAWKEGDWDAFAGQAFPMWNQTIHVIDPFEIPLDWPRWRGIDEGTAAPFCCLWVTRDPNSRRTFVYREAYQAGLTTDQQADRINDMTLPGETFQFNYADPALWQKKNYQNKVYSSSDQFKDKGILLTRADNDRLGGKRKIDNILSMQADGEPGLQIFNTCPNIISQLANLARDKNNPEDVDTTAEDHCLIGETLVATRTGAVQIKDVQAGDEVLTRYGYRRVIKSWMTRQNAEVYKVTFTNGNSITATANHPIYIAGSGFIRVDALRYGDIILSKEKTLWQTRLYSTVLSLGDTLTRLISQAGSITRQAETIANKASDSFTEKFGEVYTEIFQKGITSTTRMATLSTTTYQTLKQYQGESIYPSMQTRTRQQLSTWNRSGRLLPNGTGLKKAGHGTLNMLKMDGKIGSRPSSHANNARSNTLRNSIERGISARIIAGLHGDASLEKTTRSGLANFVIKYIQSIATHAQGLVQNFAVRVCDVQKIDNPQDVYNLTVNEHAEFFANGVLVHNSYDALKYSLTNTRRVVDQAPRKDFAHPLAGVPGL